MTIMHESADAFVGLAEAARLLGVTRQHVARLTRDGEIAAWRSPCGCRAYSVTDLMERRQTLAQGVQNATTAGLPPLPAAAYTPEPVNEPAPLARVLAPHAIEIDEAGRGPTVYEQGPHHVAPAIAVLLTRAGGVLLPG